MRWQISDGFFSLRGLNPHNGHSIHSRLFLEPPSLHPFARRSNNIKVHHHQSACLRVNLIDWRRAGNRSRRTRFACVLLRSASTVCLTLLFPRLINTALSAENAGFYRVSTAGNDLKEMRTNSILLALVKPRNIKAIYTKARRYLSQNLFSTSLKSPRA